LRIDDFGLRIWEAASGRVTGLAGVFLQLLFSTASPGVIIRRDRRTRGGFLQSAIRNPKSAMGKRRFSRR
jgi:hypothetical protein